MGTKYQVVDGFLQEDRLQQQGEANPYYPTAPAYHQPLVALHQPGVYEGIAGIELPQDIQRALNQIKAPEFTRAFEVGQEHLESVGGERTLNELIDLFEHYNIPLGMLQKLLVLQDYNLHFVIDDSGSMTALSDAPMKIAHPWVQRGAQWDRHTHPNQKMTRWQEAENRLHIMIDLIAYLPGVKLKFYFLNNPDDEFVLLNRGQSPQAFAQSAHEAIRQKFQKIVPTYRTPIEKTLRRSFKDAEADKRLPTMHYLLTDCKPTKRGITEEEAIKDVQKLIDQRDIRRNPISLLSCTNQDQDVEWLKETEERTKNASETDDFGDESREVATDQGPAFPFTYGLWVISQLVGAINPHDLDAMDENLPFTRFTLSKILGRNISNEEYQYYFDFNPHAKLYRDMYRDFAHAQEHAQKVVTAMERGRRERIAGYSQDTGKAVLPQGVEQELYAYLPLSRYTYSKLYKPVGCFCLSLFSSDYVNEAEYRQYFNSHPAVKKMPHAYQQKLFGWLNRKEKRHAQDLVRDFAEFKHVVMPPQEPEYQAYQPVQPPPQYQA